MRQPEKKRRTVGICGQLMWFLCFICLLLLVLFWFLCTQLLEPLYTTHIQKQLTEQADAIVQKLDDAIADGQTLSYWGFGSQLYVNSQFFNQLSSEIYENGGMSSFCVDISDVTLRQIFKVENLSYCNLHRTRPTDENSELPSYSTARAMRQLCRGKDKPIEGLYQAFNAETDDGRSMEVYSSLLEDAVLSIVDAKEDSDLDSLFKSGGTSALLSQVSGLDDFQLVCFLVVREEER